jgi:hypothetical protein
LTSEEFEEAFGFEQGTGAIHQQKIDKILGNIDAVQKSYAYANDRFPNPVDLSKYDKASPEYTNAAIIIQKGLRNALYNPQYKMCRNIMKRYYKSYN